MNRFDRDHKIAFARIITDLIEADFVVEADEMQFFEKIISKDGFAISETMLVEAKKMDFAKALYILKSLDDKNRDMVIDTMKQLSMSDGVCVPLEAILIFATEQVLKYDAKMHSIPNNGVNIDNLKVIYVENEESDISRQLEDGLFTITSELKLAGFDLVYIPQLVKDFRMMERDYLEKVVKYMIPSISQEKINSVCDDLRELTTSRFCRDILYKRLGLNLIDSKPSVLIKINDSDIVARYDTEEVDRIKFSNFLQIELNDDVMNGIHNIIRKYSSMISCSVFVESKPRTAKFIYSGFHRALFDLIAYERALKEYRLVFDMSCHKALVYFESLDEDKERKKLKLNPQETALYLMIVKKSFSGSGLDWREHIPRKEKENILSEYNEIYAYIGKANVVSEYKDRTQVHHIKNRVRAIQSVANIDLFIPEYVKDGNASFYRIKAKQDYVHIIKNTTL